MAILRTDPNIPIMQTTGGKVVSPTTNDPVPVVRIERRTESASIQQTLDGKVTRTCVAPAGNPNIRECTPG